MIHCSGGAQTKVMNFVDNVRVVKDKLFELPHLFRLIQEQSGTDWREMYQVFNMGHRMEFICPESFAKDRIIPISKQYGVDAKIIGHIEKSPDQTNLLTINSSEGTFKY